MRIAFDLHGTIDAHNTLSYFAWFLNKTRHVSSVIELFVISGPPLPEIMEKLPENIKWTAKVISVVDWLKERGTDMWQDKDKKWWCSDEEWWRSKGDICAHYGIDIMIDDKIEYKKHMPSFTIFLHVNKGEQND